MSTDDIPSIPRNLQRRLAKAIESRLATAPERYGEPLRASLKGYWKLRVGDYRVVYKIVRQEVWILAMLHRKRVHEACYLNGDIDFSPQSDHDLPAGFVVCE